MIKRADELRRDTVEGLMGGEGVVNRIHLLEVEDFHGKGRLYARHILEPGHSIGFHVHKGEQEAYFILKGEGLYSDNGEEVTVKAGDFCLCRSG
ncbi:MAG: cupin domain-containing protein, partial [Tissierellia bacterium]|nr:cupin domain-containing protein [Tissierellia bacterium]